MPPRFRPRLAALLPALAWLVAGPASAQVVANGGLELTAGQNFATVLPGNTYESWLSSGSGDVEFIREWVNSRGIGPAFEGTGFVDLNGVDFTGGLQQTLNTVSGEDYAIDFALSGNPGVFSDKLGDKTIDVRWNGTVVGSFTFVHTSSDSLQNLRWEQHGVVVTALGGDVLTLESTTTEYSDAGPMVDAIAVFGATPVPEFEESPESRLQWHGVSPNPFHRSATVRFSLAAAGPVRLEVVDVAGRVVRTLTDRVLPSGNHAATWDGRGGGGALVSSGIYLLRIDAAGTRRTSKVLWRR